MHTYKYTYSYTTIYITYLMVLTSEGMENTPKLYPLPPFPYIVLVKIVTMFPRSDLSA